MTTNATNEGCVVHTDTPDYKKTTASQQCDRIDSIIRRLDNGSLTLDTVKRMGVIVKEHTKDGITRLICNYNTELSVKERMHPDVNVFRSLVLYQFPDGKYVIGAMAFNAFFNYGRNPQDDRFLEWSFTPDGQKEFKVIAKDKIDGMMIMISCNPSNGNMEVYSRGTAGDTVFPIPVKIPYLKGNTLRDVVLALLPKNASKIINDNKHLSFVFELTTTIRQILTSGYTDGLFLLDVFDKSTKKHISFDAVNKIADDIGIPCPDSREIKSIDDAKEILKHKPRDTEGHVYTVYNRITGIPVCEVKGKTQFYFDMKEFASKNGGNLPSDMCMVIPHVLRGTIEEYIASSPFITTHYGDEIRKIVIKIISLIDNVKGIYRDIDTDDPKAFSTAVKDSKHPMSHMFYDVKKKHSGDWDKFFSVLVSNSKNHKKTFASIIKALDM
jgi:hypothetical protein